MIYLASPYSHPDLQVMEFRYEQACLMTGKLMKEGRVVYSPIVHNHPVAIRTSLPKGWEFWQKFDLELLGLASQLYVFTLDGWLTSTGVKAEVERARELSLVIKYVTL